MVRTLPAAVAQTPSKIALMKLAKCRAMVLLLVLPAEDGLAYRGAADVQPNHVLVVPVAGEGDRALRVDRVLRHGLFPPEDATVVIDLAQEARASGCSTKASAARACMWHRYRSLWLRRPPSSSIAAAKFSECFAMFSSGCQPIWLPTHCCRLCSGSRYAVPEFLSPPPSHR